MIDAVQHGMRDVDVSSDLLAFCHCETRDVDTPERTYLMRYGSECPAQDRVGALDVIKMRDAILLTFILRAHLKSYRIDDLTCAT